MNKPYDEVENVEEAEDPNVIVKTEEMEFEECEGWWEGNEDKEEEGEKIFVSEGMLGLKQERNLNGMDSVATTTERIICGIIASEAEDRKQESSVLGPASILPSRADLGTSNEEEDSPPKEAEGVPGGKRFLCLQCPFMTSLKVDLQHHLVTHALDRDLKCPQCPYQTARKDLLRRHVKSHLKPLFECQHCPFSSTRPDLLNRHSRKHTQERAFRCEVCPLTFLRLDHLKRHRYTHSDTKPFQCPACSYSCTTSCNLKKHLGRIHSRMECPLCPAAAFNDKRDFKDHLSTHAGEKPYRCGQCPYKAEHRAYLKEHLTTHEQDKPFQCGQCKYSATRRRALESHLRTHSGERPFRCTRCSFSTVSKSNLTKHERKHSKSSSNIDTPSPSSPSPPPPPSSCPPSPSPLSSPPPSTPPSSLPKQEEEEEDEG